MLVIAFCQPERGKSVPRVPVSVFTLRWQEVVRLLIRVIYIGHLDWGVQCLKAQNKPIIPPNVFERVQAHRAENLLRYPDRMCIATLCCGGSALCRLRRSIPFALTTRTMCVRQNPALPMPGSFRRIT